MNPLVVDLAGQTFGRWHVESYAGHGKWTCRCECGTVRHVRGTNLRFNGTTSCGCGQKEAVAKAGTKHGRYRSQEYKSWRAMLRRCTDREFRGYKDYGGRGITVCDRWMIFANFYADMGPCPEGHSIDRIESDEDYRPGNCRWATRKQQSRNTRRTRLIVVGGQPYVLVDAAEKFGLPAGVIRKRLRLGWSDEAAVLTPINPAFQRKKKAKPCKQ